MTLVQEQTSDFFWATSVLQNNHHFDGNLEEVTADDLSHALWMLGVLWRDAASSVIRQRVEDFFINKMRVRCLSVEQFAISLTSPTWGGGGVSN